MDAIAALGDPTRRRILELLVAGELGAGELADEFPVSRPAVSRHLRVLRDAGLVRVRIDGQRRVYAVDPRPLAEFDAWLEPYRRLWAQRLDALGTEIRRGRRNRRSA
ncbi:metalloregulator ArsR/SmtB family transcription factor [soil metagenome]